MEFCNSPMRYKERICYNEFASKYLDTNILINDYLSGRFKITDDKKIISQTLMDKGFHYPENLIEMQNQTHESAEDETSNTIKIDIDEETNNKNESLTNNEQKV